MARKPLLVLGALLLIAQFFRPDRSVPAHSAATDMLVMTGAPEHISALVRQACYDCHSYETSYPFYSSVTPVNFWIQHHVSEAREELNFSRWDLAAGSEAAGESGEEITEGEMPLPSYTWLHAEARLSPADRDALATWFKTTMGGGEQGDTRHRHRHAD